MPMIHRPIATRRLFFWFWVASLLVGPQGLHAQSSAGWPVKWSAGGKEFQGFLTWDDQGKKTELRTADGKTVTAGRNLLIYPQQSPVARPTVQEFPDRAVAILSFQEKLSGRLQSSFQTPGPLQVGWPGASAAEAWNPAVAAAWLFHPEVTVLAAGDFAGNNGLRQVPGSPSGRAALELKSPVQVKARPALLDPATSRLWQVAFFEPNEAPGGTLIQSGLRLEGASEVQELLELKYNAEKTHWQFAPGGNLAFEHTPIERRPGWHFLSLLVEKHRTRLCIDEKVLAETRSTLLPNQPIAEFQLATEPGQSLLIDAFGYFAFQSIPPVVQRPLDQDLVQIDGGHELMGENRVTQAELAALRSFLPKQAPAVGRWVSGPVAVVTFRGLGNGLWNLTNENDYLSRMGLLQPPPKGFDRVEGSFQSLSPTALTIALSQGGSLQIPLQEIQSISFADYQGLKLLEARPHHLGDEIDLKVTPPEPEGNKLSIAFENDPAHANVPTTLAVDVLQVLGSNIAPFIDSIARGELITEVWLNDKLLGTLNSQVKDRNETPQRLYFDIPNAAMTAGPNRLEFRQKGQKNDPNYLDDLSILGIRLYQKSNQP